MVVQLGEEFVGMEVCPSMWQFAKVMGVMGNMEEVLNGTVVCEGQTIPCPPPPMQVATAASDPHLVGFLGQHYDVTGTSGRIYSLVADRTLYINAMFSTAYTTGIHLDSELQVQKFRPHGTWMSDIAIIALASNASAVSLVASVSQMAETHSEDASTDLCTLKPGECFHEGIVSVNGKSYLFVGSYTFGPDFKFRLLKMKSFGRVTLQASKTELAIDFVPPPVEWNIQSNEGERAQFSHLNLKLIRMELSPTANGLLGCTVRLQHGANGQPVMKAYDKNGLGKYKDTLQSSRTCHTLMFSEGVLWVQVSLKLQWMHMRWSI